jgi:hypothetical protein
MDLYDLRQNKGINDAQGSAERAAAKADQFGEQLRGLERRMAKLIAVNEALWQLLKEAGQLSEEHLTQRVEAIEARSADRTRTVTTCQKCKRATTTKHVKCMYCGTELPRGTVFDQLF